MSDGSLPENVADRLALEDLLIRYCTAIDEHDWELMDTVFLPGALWDSTSVGGTAGSYQETRSVQAEMLAGLVMFHQLSNIAVTVDGDRATAKSYVSAPIGTNGPDGFKLLVTVGAWYHDQLVRTDDGWRIAERIEEGRWTTSAPS